MKLINKTRYDSKQLRAVLIAVHNEEAKRRGRLPQWNRVTVKVSRRLTRSNTSGHTFLRGIRVHLTIPAGTCTTAALTAVWLHELQHLYGLDHGDLSPSVMWCREAGLEPWIAAAFSAAETGMLQEAPEPVPVPLTEDEKASRLDARRQEKLVRLEERMRSWESKKTRAERALAKLRKQYRYYEGAIAAKKGKP